jgi:BirA family biotin operon repressor/biotin-[acetyl-CoA-carboxylase] ligase
LYKIPANTLFVGKHIVFVPECHSTNTLALQLSQSSLTTEGTIVITNSQTAGRGQRGNSWEAAPGMNLTFSIILKPGFLALQNQFYLNIVVSLALRDFLSKKLTIPIAIKWPNDILVHERKICGILIENVVQGSKITAAVLGIGLNVNQTDFNTPTATSLKLLMDTHTDVENVLHALLEFVEARYLQLRQHKEKSLFDEYVDVMFWRNEEHTFLANGNAFSGTIVGIDVTGKLAVRAADENKYFDLKEITFVK